MKVKPMLFNTEMVSAILAGDKTQARRPIGNSKQWPSDIVQSSDVVDGQEVACGFECANGDWHESVEASPWQVGDLIYVLETFRRFDAVDECDHADFPCPCPRTGAPIYFADYPDPESKWTPSIHMPRKASRLTLKVTGVRIERVQGISEQDAWAEGFHGTDDDVTGGICGYCQFAEVWQQVYGDSWDNNDWVWVIEFEVIHQNVDSYLAKLEAA